MAPIRIAKHLLLSIAPLLLLACASAPESTSRSRLAFFGVEVRQFRPDQKLVRRIEDFLPKLVEELEAFRVVPASEVKEHLRTKRGRARPCLEAACQVRVGRQVSAAAALALRIERNLVQECDVYASLYQLRKSGADQRSRARAGCQTSDLKDSMERAVCRVLVSVAGGTPAEQDARHKQCLAAAELLWLAQDLDQFRHRSLSGSAEELTAGERQLAEEALALRSRYQALQKEAQAPVWSIAAECGSGGIYEAFAQILTRAIETLEVPRTVQKQGDAAAQSFRSQITKSVEERAGPLRKQAADIYRACLKRAEELKLSSKYTEEARQHLTSLETR